MADTEAQKQPNQPSPTVPQAPVVQPAAQPQAAAPASAPRPLGLHERLVSFMKEEEEARLHSENNQHDLLQDIATRKRDLLANEGGERYSVEEHMSVALKNYGVQPEIVYGAAKWIGLDSFSTSAMKQIVKAYAERKV